MRRKSFASKKPESSFESWSENMPRISKSLGVRDFSLKMAKTATTSLLYNIGYPAKDLSFSFFANHDILFWDHGRHHLRPRVSLSLQLSRFLESSVILLRTHRLCFCTCLHYTLEL